MTAKNRLRFDPNTLKSLGGNKVFSRGEAYAQEGKVEILRDAAEHVAYLADIKARHGRRRNFMKLLE